MLTDPQTITVNSVAKTMPRTKVGDKTAAYANSDETFGLDVVHAVRKNGDVQSTVRFVQRKIVTNPLDSTNDWDSAVISLMIIRPAYGFSATEIDQLITGFKTWLTTAMVTSLYGQES